MNIKYIIQKIKNKLTEYKNHKMRKNIGRYVRIKDDEENGIGTIFDYGWSGENWYSVQFEDGSQGEYHVSDLIMLYEWD